MNKYFSDSESVRLAIIAGIRPQFVKMAALLDTIEIHNQSSLTKISSVCINTGQHYDDSLSIKLIQDLNLEFDFQLTL